MDLIKDIHVQATCMVVSACLFGTVLVLYWIVKAFLEKDYD